MTARYAARIARPVTVTKAAYGIDWGVDGVGWKAKSFNTSLFG